MLHWLEIINEQYPAGTPLRDIYMRHCCAVASLATEIAWRRQLPIDSDLISDAAMLHDVGIVRCDAPGIHCHGTHPYICHGYLGADMLRAAGVPEEIARVAETHTGSGLTPEDITLQSLPLPAGRDYMPRTQLERLICYADKFYSKSGTMQRKPFDVVRRSMAAHGDAALARFDQFASEFGRVD